MALFRSVWMGGVSAFGALVAGLEPTFFQGSDASRAVDTPPSICTSLGVKMGPKEGDLGGGGGGRLRLIDAAALTPPLPTHTTAHQGAKEGNLNEAGRWHSNGFDYFRQANGLCWLLRLMANRLQTNILVCLTLAQ